MASKLAEMDAVKRSIDVNWRSRFSQFEIEAERKAQSDAQLLAEQKIEAVANASEDKIQFLELQGRGEVFTGDTRNTQENCG